MKTNIEKLYLAFIEEKCHIHPTAPIRFDEDTNYEDIYKIRAIIGGFDCGIVFSNGDVLQWLMEKDIRPSEIKEYDVEII